MYPNLNISECEQHEHINFPYPDESETTYTTMTISESVESVNDTPNSMLTSNTKRSSAYFYLWFLYIGVGLIACCCISFCSCVALKYYYDKKQSEEDTHMASVTVDRVASVSISPSFEDAHMTTNRMQSIKSFHSSGNSLALEATNTRKSTEHVHTHTTLGCDFNEDDDEDEEEFEDSDLDVTTVTTPTYKITIGIEKHNVNIDEDEFVIKYDDTKGNYGGEVSCDVNELVAAQAHHQVQMTNLASEGGFDSFRNSFRL